MVMASGPVGLCGLRLCRSLGKTSLSMLNIAIVGYTCRYGLFTNEALKINNVNFRRNVAVYRNVLLKCFFKSPNVLALVLYLGNGVCTNC